MKTKMFILFNIVLVSHCLYGLASTHNKTQTYFKPENRIIFNGVHQIGRQKWHGPYHNQLVYTWFTPYALAKDKQEYRNLINRLRKYGGKYIGYYYSSTTTYPLTSVASHRKFPEPAIPHKAIKSSWILLDAKGQPVRWSGWEDRYFLDIGIQEVQEAIVTRAIRNTQQLGLNMLFLDNMYYKYWAPPGKDKEQWTQACLSLLLRARELTAANNLKLVVNAVTSVELFAEFAPYLDGISYEMGAHPYRLKTRDRYEEELQSYDKVMAMGKSIFLWTDTLKDKGKRWDEDGRKVAITAMLVMPKEQPYWGGIYVANPRYEAWPVGGWAMWPEQLGNPLSPRKWDGNTVTRKFERGLISVTVGEKPKFSITTVY
ncbi:MAG: putative glycoside hydrolase [Planctomycetota bacterium]|jgi:hypothetical protein